MKNRKEIQKYFKNNYYNKNENYKAILSEIREDKIMNRNKISKAISTAILTLLGATTIAFASTQIYNNYIKEKDSTHSTVIFDNGTGMIDYETDLSQNDMFINANCTLHHKIITNIEDYKKYKERISELPEMKEEDFNKTFLIIVVNTIRRQPHERDLELYDITADETTTHVIMKQKENPDYSQDYSKKDNVWYAVVDKTLLKENLETVIEHNYIENPNFVKLSELPDDYNISDAIKDGCFVEDKYKVLSDNIYAIDEFIEKTEKNETTFIRVYSKYDDYIRIMDVEYKNGLFTINAITSENKDILVNTFNFIEKENKNEDNLINYDFQEADDNGDKIWWIGIPFVTIYQ